MTEAETTKKTVALDHLKGKTIHMAYWQGDSDALCLWLTDGTTLKVYGVGCNDGTAIIAAEIHIDIADPVQP